ncbi:MAG: hypothetical protein VX246_03595 [Myxococcota bacterium]|nr:hypothetical protein [Myxococcota bacterium]
MKFALFYQIPIARSWTKDSEFETFNNTIEQAVAGEKAGCHSFRTAENHFLGEFLHCSNPEIPEVRYPVERAE